MRHHIISNYTVHNVNIQKFCSLYVFWSQQISKIMLKNPPAIVKLPSQWVCMSLLVLGSLTSGKYHGNNEHC